MRAAIFGASGIGRIDLHARGCFVLKAKQGSAADAGESPLFSLSPLIDHLI